ncbi:hypothetical protein B0O99DRAFT_510110 [Bisporella sp. PMI_857]|nr:hypothetical protein B0O99DRAFT_510110 [Bisporella sp. PMI_857]
MSDDLGEEGSLFNISIGANEPSEEVIEGKLPRDHQSEDNFQLVKRQWKAKVDNGEIAQTLKFPINNPSKQEAQLLLHAIEELYFMRRYVEASAVADAVLQGTLGSEFRNTISSYKERCESRRQR